MKKIFTISVVFFTCFLSTTSSELFAFDNNPVTGNLISVVGNTGVDAIQGMTFDPNTNTMFAVDNVTDSLFSIDTTTGLGTLIG